MYYYTVRDAKTNQLIIKGTANDLVNSGRYASVSSVKNCFLSWKKKTERGQKCGVIWSRSGSEEPVRMGCHRRTSEARLHTNRCRTWQQKEARETRQASAEAAGKPKNPDWYTTERLCQNGTMPEHLHKFAQPPIEPPKDTLKNKVSPLRWDVYEVECLNWERRKEGKKPLSYGQWRAGIR